MTAHAEPTKQPPPGLYLAFTPDTPEHVAWEMFIVKYGYEPQWVGPLPNVMQAGPVKETPAP